MWNQFSKQRRDFHGELPWGRWPAWHTSQDASQHIPDIGSTGQLLEKTPQSRRKIIIATIIQPANREQGKVNSQPAKMHKLGRRNCFCTGNRQVKIYIILTVGKLFKEVNYGTSVRLNPLEQLQIT